MGCWSPIELKSETQKKMGLKGNIVPCGRCLGCLSKRRRDWTMRLSQELKSASSASFLTLTYDDENLPYVDFGDKIEYFNCDKSIWHGTGFWPELKKLQNNTWEYFETFGIYPLFKNDLQRYLKRVRKVTPNLKYYAVGEYGSETKRPHYHAIVFNADPEVLAEKWDQGITHQGTVTDESIKYVTKYLINEDFIDNPIKPFAIMSKGLGKIYLKNATKWHKRNFTLCPADGKDNKSCIPRYYRNKIFSKVENQLLLEGVRRDAIQLSEGSVEAETEIKSRRVKRKNSKSKSKSNKL